MANQKKMKAYAVKGATTAEQAKKLLEEGWESCGKTENVSLFRKKLEVKK